MDYQTVIPDSVHPPSSRQKSLLLLPKSRSAPCPSRARNACNLSSEVKKRADAGPIVSPSLKDLHVDDKIILEYRTKSKH